MDRTEASDAFNAGSIPVGHIFYSRSIILAEKWKEFLATLSEWAKDVKTLIKDNLKIFFIILGFVVAVIIALVVTTVLAKKNKEAVDVVVEETVEAEEEFVIPEDPMEEDAYPEINDLMKKYYNAAANGDADTISTLRTGVDDKEIIVIQKKADYVSSYPVIKCYTKKGPIEDSFLVYVYYEVKIEGYEEQIPGLNVWYVCRNDSGSYYINEDPQDEKVTEYCKVLSVQDDVVDLSNTINVKFNEIMTENTELAAYMDELAVQMKVSVGEELAKAEVTPEVTPEVVEEETEEAEVQTEKKVKATTVVNVRSSDSEGADKLGKAQEGQIFTLLEDKLNGWSKIEFEGQEAYIKSEFLEPVGGSSSTNTEDTATKDQPTDEEAAAASPESGSATVKETINLREKASTESNKITVIYGGEKLEVLQKNKDGWSKVKYNGKTGYVKSEFLE